VIIFFKRLHFDGYPLQITLEVNLVHLADEAVDVILTVTSVTTLDEVLELALVETAVGVGQLEGPQEVVGLLEVGANGVDLVDQILHADNAVLAEVLLDDLVVSQGSTLLVDLAVTALVQKLTDGLQVGVTVGDVGVDDGQHLLGGLGQADEATAVDLEQTEQLEDLAGLGGNLVDTEGKSQSSIRRYVSDRRDVPLDTDNEDQLGLIVNVEVALLAGSAGQADLLTLSIAVLLDVGLGALEDDTTLLLVGLLDLESAGDSKICWCVLNAGGSNGVSPERWLTIRQHRPEGLVAWLVVIIR